MTTQANIVEPPSLKSHRTPRVLSVGQCGYDHRNLSSFLKRSVGAETIAMDTPDEAIEAVRQGAFDLVLVNRILDADGSSGLALVRELKQTDEPNVANTPVMLVSNYEEARHQAEALGALPGFGKSDLYAPRAELIDRLKSVLG